MYVYPRYVDRIVQNRKASYIYYMSSNTPVKNADPSFTYPIFSH